jgi:hypothetical protein
VCRERKKEEPGPKSLIFDENDGVVTVAGGSTATRQTVTTRCITMFWR